MFGEKVRKYGFWILDFLKKGEVRKHYKDITEIIEGKAYNSKIDRYLSNLLNYAVNNTDFYSEYRDYKSIKDFPIIDKNIIKANIEGLLSQEYRGKELHCMSTSGSTGTPLTIKQNKNKRNRVLAEIIYFGEKCGYFLGDRNVYLRVWTEKNRKSRLNAFKQNLVMLDISKLDEGNLENIRKTFKNDKIKCILGYATSLDIISRYLIEKNDTPDMFSIKIVISGAEVLNEVTRVNLKKVFGCPVVSRYSNQENGILAQEPIGEKFFIINNASYYIEFLKVDSDEEAEEGELARIVVTDLFNYAMPLIRYDTGDLAVVEKHKKYGNVITSIEGRKLDFIFNTSGAEISPHSVTVNMR
ncbi:MAG: CoF synthetase, partial [Peptococcia bacterium]